MSAFQSKARARAAFAVIMSYLLLVLLVVMFAPGWVHDDGLPWFGASLVIIVLAVESIVRWDRMRARLAGRPLPARPRAEPRPERVPLTRRERFVSFALLASAGLALIGAHVAPPQYKDTWTILAAAYVVIVYFFVASRGRRPRGKGLT